MEIAGQVIEVMPVESVPSKDGNSSYDSQIIVIQTQEQYSKKVALRVFGSDKIQKCQCQVGETITASFDLNSRDWTDKNNKKRWSTDVNVWRIQHGVASQAPQYQTAQQMYQPQAAPPMPVPGYAPQPQYQQMPPQPQYQQPAQPQQNAMPFPPPQAGGNGAF